MRNVLLAIVALLALNNCGNPDDKTVNLKKDSIYGYWHPYSFEPSGDFFIFLDDTSMFVRCGTFEIQGQENSGVLFTWPDTTISECVIHSPIQWRIDEREGLVFY